MLTIAVLNQKGGVGKTTLAANLAAAAHLAGRRTLLIDSDRQGSSLDWMAARAEGSKLEGLAVVKADKDLSMRKLRDISAGRDVVLIDGPPRLGDVTRAAAVAADVALVPLRPGPLDWWAAAETLDLITSADTIREELGRSPVRRLFVLNGAASGTKLVRAALEAVAEVGELAPVVIGNRVAYPESMFSGESVLTIAPGSPAADEITRLWTAIAEEGKAEA